MATDNKSTKGATGKNGLPNDVPEGWVEDVRSLPLYNVRDCKGGVTGRIVDVQILNGSGGGDRDTDGAKAFSALVVLLTKPCQAVLNGDLVTVDAGKEVYVHGAALNDLDVVALNPKEVYEYILRPVVGEDGRNKELKTGGGYRMPIWERFKNPKPAPRESVTSRVPQMRAHEFRALLEQAKIHGVGAAIGAMGAVDTTFDPKQLTS